MEDRLKRFREVMERDSAGFGFSYDKKKSRDEFPVFSKQMSNNWDLCWTLQHINMFALAPQEGFFSPNLDLRYTNLYGSTDRARGGEFLLFRYQHILPGFGNAYWKFRNLEELDRAVSAHLRLYGMMAPMFGHSVAIANLNA
jgi:hypothetical protein